MQETRDWAAHGWYERVTDEVADRAVAIMCASRARIRSLMGVCSYLVLSQPTVVSR